MYGYSGMLKVCSSGILQKSAVIKWRDQIMRLIILMIKLMIGVVTSIGKMLGGVSLLVVSASTIASDEKKRRKNDK